MSYQPTQRISEWPQQDSQTISQEQQSGNATETFRKGLSPNEIRVLRECNKESFYYRCLPLSFLFSGLAYIGMKNGYLQKGVKYGYVPKMMLGVFIGYIGGKVSYQNQCEEKIMKLPDSNLGNALRKRKGLAPIPVSEVAPVTEEYSLDLRDHIEGFDSYDQTVSDFPSYPSSDLTSDDASDRNSSVTYDDLRRANREDYINKVTDKHKKQSPDANRSSILPSSSSTSLQNTRSAPTAATSKNKYGDEWSL